MLNVRYEYQAVDDALIAGYALENLEYQKTVMRWELTFKFVVIVCIYSMCTHPTALENICES